MPDGDLGGTQSDGSEQPGEEGPASRLGQRHAMLKNVEGRGLSSWRDRPSDEAGAPAQAQAVRYAHAMRRGSVLIRTAIERGVKIYEAALTPQNLIQADELFLTNAVRGIEWVSSYKTKRYFHSMAEKLTAWIQDDLTSP